jgi:hypothetical protein
VTNNAGEKVKDDSGNYIMEKKLRCIDDAKMSLSNICEYTYETVSLCSFSLACHVARTVHSICAQKGWSTPVIIMGTNDMCSSYSQIPCSQLGYTVVYV